MTNIFDKLIKVGDRFQNKNGIKMTLVEINHEKPEGFVYEFDVDDKSKVYGGLNDVLTELERI